MAIVLASSLTIPVDVGKVLKMLTIHDLCEIHAGDNPAFNPKNTDKYLPE